MIKFWHLLKKELRFKDNVLSIYHNQYHYDKIDQAMDFTVLEMSSWVMIIPITVDNKIVIAKQFRAGTEECTLEFPGGAINSNEEPEIAAQRELAEETGITTAKIVKLGKIDPNPAFMNNVCHIYLAKDSEIDSDQSLDPFEDIELEFIDKDTLDAMILSGKFSQSISLAAYALYLLYDRNKES